MGVIGVERGIIDLDNEPFTMLGIPTVSTGVFGGIIIGLVSALVFNKYYRISLPPYLGFFAGKRFVPIVTAFAAIVIGVVLSFVWPPIEDVIDSFSEWASGGSAPWPYGSTAPSSDHCSHSVCTTSGTRRSSSRSGPARTRSQGRSTTGG
jgi:glucose PTS system EIICB or EIICBA component